MPLTDKGYLFGDPCIFQMFDILFSLSFYILLMFKRIWRWQQSRDDASRYRHFLSKNWTFLGM